MTAIGFRDWVKAPCVSPLDLEVLKPNLFLTRVPLCEPYKLDFGDYGWLHPVHKNECIVYSSVYSEWVILDFYGDIYSFVSIDDALEEFLSESGHSIWLDGKPHHKEDLYFADPLLCPPIPTFTWVS